MYLYRKIKKIAYLKLNKNKWGRYFIYDADILFMIT